MQNHMGNGATVSKHSEKNSEMFGRRKSVNKKVLQEKLRLASEKPDSVFDLVECGISKVPEGVYSKCKVLNKQALLLQHNFLEDLKGGGHLTDLAHILVLDVSHNNIKVLPKEIKSLVHLQRFNISNNKIKKLPEEIGGLKSLHEFDCSYNDLSNIPTSIKHFRRLKSLDISNNKHIASLPVSLCFLKNLTDFKFDIDRITYPRKETTRGGLPEIQRFFKMLKGEEFFSQDGLDAAKANSPIHSPTSTSPTLQEDEDFERNILERERKKQLEYEQRLKVEKEILDSTEDNAKLIVKAQQERQKYLSDIEKHELEAQTALARQFDSENQERNKLLEQLYLEENHLNETVNLLMDMAEKRKNTDAILEKLEQEQARIDALVKVTQEESDKLRRQEMIEAMAYVLNEMETSRQKFDKYEQSKKETIAKSLRREEEDQEDLERVLKMKDEDQERLLKAVVSEEEKQRVAFQMLQFQEDSRLKRIRNEVSMIEGELARLSSLEIQKRKEKNEDEVNTLAEMRLQTAILLSQLHDERDKREERLKKTIARMEEEKDDDAKDFWLIQFQRLMDNKPQMLIDDENKLDMYVVELLLHAGAREYLPHFARHHVTELEMNQMARERLKEIGVKEEAKIEAIMSSLQSMRNINTKLAEKQEKLNPTPSSDIKENPMPPSYHAPVSSAPTLNLCAESDCVICLDKQPSVVFLTCGHVCCCETCCVPITDCPLCRQPIAQKCRLYRSS